MTDDIEGVVKDFVLKEFLPGEDPNELTDSTPLITGGVLDSFLPWVVTETVSPELPARMSSRAPAATQVTVTSVELDTEAVNLASLSKAVEIAVAIDVEEHGRLALEEEDLAAIGRASPEGASYRGEPRSTRSGPAKNYEDGTRIEGGFTAGPGLRW